MFNTLRQKYTISTYCTCRNYYSLNIDWHYTQGYVYISIPECILKVLTQIQHTPSRKSQHEPCE